MSSLRMRVIGEKRRESRSSEKDKAEFWVVLWVWFPSRGKCAIQEARKGSQGDRRILGRVWHPQSQEKSTCQEGRCGQLPPVLLSEPLASWHLGKWKKKKQQENQNCRPAEMDQLDEWPAASWNCRSKLWFGEKCDWSHGYLHCQPGGMPACIRFLH